MAAAVRILNVDDNPAGLYAKSRVLRFAGYTVLEASDGESAIATARAEKPQIIILDVNLPDISGYEVCRRIKESPDTARIGVIMTSAVFTRGADRARGIEGGADGYLIEPIEPEIVQATIQNLLRVRKAEQELQDAAAQWKATFRAISDGIALLDERGRIIRCNYACEQLLGAEESALVNSTIDDVLRRYSQEQAEAVSELTLDSDYVIRDLYMGGRWLELKFDPVYEDGKRNGMVCIIADVTDQRFAEQALREAKSIAEEANRAKDRFLAALSHELRTPLTPITLLLEDLKDDTSLSPDLRAVHEMMLRNIRLEARLIDDLLDLSRIIKGKLGLNSVLVDMHAIVAMVTEIVGGDLRDKRIELRINLEADPFVVLGDSARLHQILWNLLKNAIKFTPDGGTVSITSWNPEPGTFAVSVSDTGIGIAADALDRIFAAFEQAESDTSQRFGGLGLGLAISKNLATMHGGDLTVSSPGMNAGATFTLTLPLPA